MLSKKANKINDFRKNRPYKKHLNSVIIYVAGGGFGKKPLFLAITIFLKRVTLTDILPYFCIIIR